MTSGLDFGSGDESSSTIVGGPWTVSVPMGGTDCRVDGNNLCHGPSLLGSTWVHMHQDRCGVLERVRGAWTTRRKDDDVRVYTHTFRHMCADT